MRSPQPLASSTPLAGSPLVFPCGSWPWHFGGVLAGCCVGSLQLSFALLLLCDGVGKESCRSGVYFSRHHTRAHTTLIWPILGMLGSSSWSASFLHVFPAFHLLVRTKPLSPSHTLSEVSGTAPAETECLKICRTGFSYSGIHEWLLTPRFWWFPLYSVGRWHLHPWWFWHEDVHLSIYGGMKASHL